MICIDNTKMRSGMCFYPFFVFFPFWVFPVFPRGARLVASESSKSNVARGGVYDGVAEKVSFHRLM